MAELNGGSVAGPLLANEGVRFVFGLPSPEIDPLLARLEEHGIRLGRSATRPPEHTWPRAFNKTTGQVAVEIGNPARAPPTSSPA